MSAAHARPPAALLAALLAASFQLAACGGDERPPVAEILWDRHGVPHVHASDELALARAFGWAQAECHGERLLRLYAQARGRAAELFGEAYLDGDRAAWTAGIPERAEAWYAAQSPSARALLDAFAGGINDHARAHPRRSGSTWRRALPVSGADVLAHAQRLLHFDLVAPDAREARALLQRGSNAWAVAPSRSASGHALLVAQPHLPWSEPWLLQEARLVLGERWLYGVALVGLPVIGIGFNSDVAWTHTINPHDGADLFELVLEDGGYRFDGAVRAFEEREVELRVRRAKGGFDTVVHRVRRSVHGPVVAEEDGRALALRVVGLDRPGALEQWWRMGWSSDLASFEAALALEQLPTFNVLYADRVGHVLHQFGGLTPQRAEPERDWGLPAPGDRSDLVWDAVHPLAELPRVLDPASGWVHNANDPPWSATFPGAPRADDFPAYMAPRAVHLAAQRSARALSDDASIELGELVALARDTTCEAAERLVPELVRAARAGDDPRHARAADVLATWDRRVEPGSRGAVLFATVLDGLQQSGEVFAEGWDPARPLDTPRGLASDERARDVLAAAVDAVVAAAGDADAPWGAVYRLRDDGLDVPAAGGMRGLGILRATEFARDADGRPRAVSGDTFLAAVEFATPLVAHVQLVYGNGDAPLGPTRAEALERSADGRLRPALLSRDDVLAGPHLVEPVAPSDLPLR